MGFAKFLSNALLGADLKTIYRRIVGYPQYFEDPSYHFFMLPPELRLKVYDFVLRMDRHTAVHVDQVCSPSKDNLLASSAQLLLVCKTVYYESLPSLYGSRLFIADGKDEFIPFFKFITPNATQHLKYLAIEHHQLPDKIYSRELGRLGSSYKLALDIWPELPSLKQVTVLIGDNRFFPQGLALRSAVNFVRGVHRRKPHLGHFFFDYMQLVPGRNVKWKLSLQFQCKVLRHGRMEIAEEVQVNALVEVIEGKRYGRSERTWRFSDNDGGGVAPLQRTHDNNGVASKWTQLREIEF